MSIDTPKGNVAFASVTVPPVNGLTRADAARAFMGFAGMAVFPVNGKEPARENGRCIAWSERSTTELDVVTTWEKGWLNPASERTRHRKGIALDCGKSGMVVIDVDRPDAVPVAWWPELESAPFHGTDSGDPRRGHYLFRQPAEPVGCPKEAWGEVKGMGGYVVLPPSPHASADPEWPGGQTPPKKYRSTARYRQVRHGPVPFLPPLIADSFGEWRQAQAAADAGTVAAALLDWEGCEDPDLLGQIIKRFRGDVEAGHGRHPSMIGRMCWAVRSAQAGLIPGQLAHDTLESVFAEVKPEAMPDEFEDMWAWAMGQLTDTSAAETRAKWTERQAARSIPRQASGQESTPDPSQWLPETFWGAREALQHIRDAAWSRGRAADSVLYVVLARLAAMLPPGVTVDSGISTPASLNLGVALVGPSGSGKSGAVAVGSEVLADPQWLEQADHRWDLNPLGSGEGIAEAYYGTAEEATGEIHKSGPYKGDPVMKSVRRQVRWNALFYADEGESLTKLLQRTGATIGSVLRAALTGGTIGQKNGREETTRIVEAGHYSFALVIGFQPTTIGPLIEDAGAGTPQRFVYCPSTDPQIPDDAPAWPHALRADVGRIVQDAAGGDPFIGAGTPPEVKRPMSLCESAREELRLHNLAKNRGQHTDPQLDSHWPVMRLKLAGLLALLDGRYDVTDEDWQLSAVMWTTSSAVRDAVVAAAEADTARKEQAKEDRYVRQEARAHLAKSGAEADAVDVLARQLAQHVHANGATTRSALNRPLKSTRRPLLDQALDLSVDMGWVLVEPGAGRTVHVRPGASKPSE
jgi:hypothetical protein